MKQLIITVDLDIISDESEICDRVMKALNHGLAVSKEQWVAEVRKGVPYEFRSAFGISPQALALKVELKGRG